MAIKDLNGLDRLNISDPWQDYTGDQVEDAITRSITDLDSEIITGGTYDGKEWLNLTKKGEGKEIKIQVTPMEPSYTYFVKIFGIRIGDKTFNQGEITVTNNVDAVLLVGAYGLIQTVGDPSDKGGRINATLTYGNLRYNTPINLLSKNSFEYNSNGNIIGVKDNVELAEISITKELFSEFYRDGYITITLNPNPSENASTVSDTLDVKITCEVPTLKYNSSSYIVNNTSVTFSLIGGSPGEYSLQGYNNGSALNGMLIDKLTYNGLVPGLNQLVVRAVQGNIVSNWVLVDLICSEQCEDTIIAINNVSTNIANNSIVELYHLTAYSPNKEEVVLSTYLSDYQLEEYNNPSKQETLNAYSYDSLNIKTINYKKYIEEEQSGDKYLSIKVGETIYQFYEPSYDNKNIIVSNYKIMTVDPPNLNYIYYKDSNIEYNYDQNTGQLSNVFQKNNLNPNLEVTDGWGESDGVCYFRVTAQDNSLFINPLNLRLNQTTGYSIELGFKTYNISDKHKSIFTIGKLQLWPTQLVWWDEHDSAGESSYTFKSRNSLFQEGINTHIMITVHPKYKINPNDPYYPKFLKGNQNAFDQAASDFSFNLVRIYVNGVIDRAYVLTDAELSELTNSYFQIAPKTSDIDFYLFRVYNNEGVSDAVVQKNYNSYLFNKQDKDYFYNKNNILDNGAISFAKSRLSQNTIVLVLPKGLSFPNYTWDDEMKTLAKKSKVTQFIEYSNPTYNQVYGGRITNGQIKGQGSSANRYLIWNVQNSFGKHKDEDGNKIDSEFISYSPDNFDPNTNKFKSEANVTLRNEYIMPSYSGQKDTSSKVKKSVGKVNWASSMQSHKMGACKLYDDAYKTLYPQSGILGKKAVHQEPFLYFYWETDLEDVSKIELNDVLNAGNNVKFAGFQTWGAGKGDNYESGYDKNITPEYLMLEGGENGNTSVNFRTPWHALQCVDSEGKIQTTPTISISDSKNNPEQALYIDDESIVYENQGAWDIDFGCGDDKKSFLPTVKTSLKRFREFYDFVYKHDYTFVIKSGSSAEANDFVITENEKTVVDSKHKYVVTANRFTIGGVAVSGHTSGDVYRYDSSLNTWVPAGLYYENNSWQKFNIFTEFPEGGKYIDNTIQVIKDKFTNGIKEFIDVNDIAFHQAFIKFVSGTDNRAKNTYFQIIGPRYIKTSEDVYERPEIAEGDWSDYKIRLIGDDLDTIFVTDNSGLQSKPYNLLEVSYDASFKDYWGDAHNIFFYMFDQCFEQDIITNLKGIIQVAFGGNNINNKDSYFYKNFFNVQETFPEVAYNHTSRLYYENAYIIKERKVISDYTNNFGVDPIGQIHGSCLECEKQFIKERIDFLSGYAQTNLGEIYSTTMGQGGASNSMKISMKITPYQDFYPNYGFGTQGGSSVAIPKYALKENGYLATSLLAKKDNLYDILIQENGEQPYQGLYQIRLYKTLDILGNQNTILPSLERGVELTIDNAKVHSGIPIYKMTGFNDSQPVLEKLSLRSVELPSTLSLTNCVKLREIDLSNSIVQSVIFPISGRLKTIILPETIKSLEIYNNPGLQNITFQGYENIENVYIDCAKCGQFNVADFCENLSSVSLKSITLKNINNIYLTEETLDKLINSRCVLEGEITVVDNIGESTPKDISFATKLKLVNKFGNIDSGLNGLKVNYESTPISRDNIQYPDEVSAFYDMNGDAEQLFSGLFTLNITTGNNVNIVDRVNPFNPSVIGYLDISYSLQSTLSGVSINQLNGTITLNQNVNTNSIAKVVIQIKSGNNTFKNDGSGTNPSPTRVSFAWKAPLIGDYAYADGTFSSYYNPNKTIIGLVYAKNEINSESGTVYIIGKEYSNTTPHYSGYNTRGENSSANVGTVHEQIYQLHFYVNNILGYTNYYPSNLGKYIPDNLSEIVGSMGTTIMALPMSGKEDTAVYVSLVNSILPKLQNQGISLPIVNSSEGAYIENIEKLNTCCSILDGSSLNSSELYNSSLLFPYFYSAYLYEPSVTKDGETLHEQYKKGNWYAPSIGEMSKIIYYRGYSAVSIFNAAGYVRQPIVNNIPNGGTDISTPIFSLASARGYVADVWKNIVGSNTSGTVNNIVTTRNLDSGTIGDNYSYQTYPQSYEYITYNTEWIEGSYNENNNLTWTAKRNAWSYTKHQGIPFTQFNYSKS